MPRLVVFGTVVKGDEGSGTTRTLEQRLRLVVISLSGSALFLVLVVGELSKTRKSESAEFASNLRGNRFWRSSQVLWRTLRCCVCRAYVSTFSVGFDSFVVDERILVRILDRLIGLLCEIFCTPLCSK